MRLSGRVFLVLLALMGLVIVAATDQVVPATSERQADLRIWLTARAAGITAYLLLALQVVMGLVLAHPTNQATWRLSKRLFPWHENVWIFVLAFLGAHIVTIAADPYAGVGIGGSLVPGLSAYRSSAVALGTMGLYALLATGLTARYAQRLPDRWWLRIHRLSLAVFGLAWLHGMLAGTDSPALMPMYLATGAAVLGSAAWRHWVVRRIPVPDLAPAAVRGRDMAPPSTRPTEPPREMPPTRREPLHAPGHREPVPVEVTVR